MAEERRPEEGQRWTAKRRALRPLRLYLSLKLSPLMLTKVEFPALNLFCQVPCPTRWRSSSCGLSYPHKRRCRFSGSSCNNSSLAKHRVHQCPEIGQQSSRVLIIIEPHRFEPVFMVEGCPRLRGRPATAFNRMGVVEPNQALTRLEQEMDVVAHSPSHFHAFSKSRDESSPADCKSSQSSMG